MKTLKVSTSTEDILSLVNYFCSTQSDGTYQLCEDKVTILQSSPLEAPKWIIPVSFSNPNETEQNQIKYFVYDHGYSSLHIQDEDPNTNITCSFKPNKSNVWRSPFHHWIIQETPAGKVVTTVFNIPKTLDPVPIPDYMGDRCFYEYDPQCPVLFLTASDVVDAFPFRELVNHIEKIELKVTEYGEPVWLLTQLTGKKHVVYPFSLHRFYDELNNSRIFGELRNPKENEEFVVYHRVSNAFCAVISLKTYDGRNLSMTRFKRIKH